MRPSGDVLPPPRERVWSTDDVTPRERFDYWRDAICAAYVRLDASPVGAGTFSGSVTAQDWPGLRLSRVASSAQHVRRRPDDGSDDCLVSLQVRGRSRIGQSGRSAALVPGTLALYEAGRAYSLDFDDPYEQVVVQFPRAELVARGVDVSAVAARRCEGGMARVSAALVLAALAEAHDLGPSARVQLSSQVLDCLTTALVSCAAFKVDAQAARSAQRYAVLALVRERLTDPGLSVEGIARASGRSPRSLQRLFADQPHGLSEVVRRARLARATAALVDPARADCSIARIAAEHGYADAAHFARVFRSYHGSSPSEHRHGWATRTTSTAHPTSPDEGRDHP